VVAKDALGNDITVKGWLESHPPGDRTLAQGLKVKELLSCAI
jgi:cytochrome b6-f complex iron-sulfur subunit